MALVVDEAWDKADPVQLVSAGYSGIIGYVSQNTTGKNLSRADVDRAHAAGLAVGLVYEFDPYSATGGDHNGERDAHIALSHAMALQAPEGMCLYAAIDYNARGPALDDVVSYAAGFGRVVNAAGFRSGVYGSYYACAAVHAAFPEDLLWQTYAWSDGLWLAGVAVRQVHNGIHLAGAVVDQDVTEVRDWGQWAPGADHPKPSTGDSIVSHWQNVAQGDKGQAVKVAQGLLIAHGLTVGSRSGLPDGVYGPATASSTRALQSRYHLAQDGVFGPHTASVAMLGVDVA